MTRFTSAFFATTLLFSSALAGPACSQKYSQSAQCAELCKSGWGFSGKAEKAGEGMFLGVDPWGIVIQKTGKSLEEWIADACGVQVASSTSTKAPEATVKGGLGSSPAEVTQATTTSTTSSSSAAPPPPSTSREPKTTEVPKKAEPTKEAPPPPPPPPPPPTTTRQREPEPQPTQEGNNGNDDNNNGNQGDNGNNRNQGGAVAGGGGGGVGGESAGDQQAWLDSHNSFRAQHGAGQLTWSDDLAAAAQKWANNCEFEHSGGTLGPFGENLASGTGGSYNVQSAFKSWADEAPQFNPGNPSASHFTQVVWKDSKQLGCAVSQCSGIFDASFGPAKYYVCEYRPAGNVEGRFGENVQ